VLPCIEVEAVEGADAGEESGGGQQGGAEPGGAGDGRDEDGGGEEEADGEFFGEALGEVVGQRADVDEEHPGGEESGEQGVEVEGSGVDAIEEVDEGKGAEGDDGEEAAAVVVVEAVAGFEAGFMVGVAVVEVCGNPHLKGEMWGTRCVVGSDLGHPPTEFEGPCAFDNGQNAIQI